MLLLFERTSRLDKIWRRNKRRLIRMVLKFSGYTLLNRKESGILNKIIDEYSDWCMDDIETNLAYGSKEEKKEAKETKGFIEDFMMLIKIK